MAQGADNEWYLKHRVDGSWDSAGTPFLDFENSSGYTDRNSIIYSHNMRNGTMFAYLTEYQRQAYYDGHPAMSLLTPGGDFRVEIFAAFTASPDEAGTYTRIVFVRDRANRKKWIAILSTDLELSEEQIIELYGKRWSIEVFFKVCKSYLMLVGEFRQLSYDAITAHTAIVFLRYAMIAVEKRRFEDDRTVGDLFYLLCDEIPGSTKQRG